MAKKSVTKKITYIGLRSFGDELALQLEATRAKHFEEIVRRFSIGSHTTEKEDAE